MSERKFDDFDEYASSYREIHSDNIRLTGADSFYFAELKVRLLIKPEKNIPLKVLDVGCGDGATEVYFKKYFPAWQVTAIDVSVKSVEEAKNKNIEGTIFKVYDGKNIDAAEEEFDVVFMAGVLHHMNFSLHDGLLKEIKRVLKKQGRFYLFEQNPFNPFTRYLVNTCEFDKDARLLKSNYTRGILMKQDFKIQKKEYIIFFPRKWFFLKMIFLEKYLRWLSVGAQYYFVSKKN